MLPQKILGNGLYPVKTFTGNVGLWTQSNVFTGHNPTCPVKTFTGQKLHPKYYAPLFIYGTFSLPYLDNLRALLSIYLFIGILYIGGFFRAFMSKSSF